MYLIWVDCADICLPILCHRFSSSACSVSPAGHPKPPDLFRFASSTLSLSVNVVLSLFSQLTKLLAFVSSPELEELVED